MEAVSRFGEDGAFDPPATRTALAQVTLAVLLLTGEFDLNSPPETVAAFADLFPDARLSVQPGAGLSLARRPGAVHGGRRRLPRPALTQGPYALRWSHVQPRGSHRA
ncbi:hypothetical protein ABZX97_29060 [Streptomyces seoulensis]|uniref:alpha/beta fold hydrolase n=1 Tax=Streptomyces seoulensis TaxID=73044 RepID=UPI0033AE2DC9